MNTIGENNYHDVLTSDRIYIKTIETREIEYDFKITPEIMDNFRKWKLDVLETTDEEPTLNDILDYLKNSKINSVYGGCPAKVEIVEYEVKYIDEENPF